MSFKKNTTSIIFTVALFLFSHILLSPANAQTDENRATGNLGGSEATISSPEIRINIPGLYFTPAKDVLERSQNAVEKTGQTVVEIPFLAEYITRIYRYAVVMASLLSVIMIIVSGLQWTISGGSADAIGAAKKRITNAIIGLILAVGSYTLLYTINPALVNFRALTIPYLAAVDIGAYDRGAPTASPEYISSPTTQRGRNRSGKRTATEVTQEAMKGGRSTVRKTKSLSIGDHTDISEQCPLFDASLRKLEENYPSPTSIQNVNYSGFDELFKRYSNCVPNVPWTTIKAMAHTESGFRPGVENSIGFTGLFQTKENYCKSILDGTEGKRIDEYSSNYCKSMLKNPEVSTMVGTAMMLQAVTIMNNVGCNIPDEDSRIFFIYLRHQSGPAILRGALEAMKEERGTCNYKESCPYVYRAWQPRKIVIDDKNPSACSGFDASFFN